MESSSDSSSDEKSRKKRKAEKKEKKHKKDKKHKKSSKHSRKRHSSSCSGDSSEEQWVEAGPSEKSGANMKTAISKGEREIVEKVVRKDDEDWANFGEILPTYSNDGRRSRKQREREEQRLLSSIDMAGQTDKELNPYWKDGGKGLPAHEKEDSKPKAMGSVGDGGLAWLKKSFERAKQQAKDENKPLEDVVAQRWGSLEAFYELLEEAEKKARGTIDGRDRHRGKSFKRPSRYSDSEEEKTYKRREEEDDAGDRRSSKCRGKDRDRDRERSWRKEEVGSSNWRKSDGKAEELIKPDNVNNPNRVDIEKMEACQLNLADEGMNPLEEERRPPAVLTDKEMNELNAKLFKAEMLGDLERVAEIKVKISEAQQERDLYIKEGRVPGDKPTKVITKVILGNDNRKRTRDKPTESHVAGERVRYFPDDDRKSLKSMFEREKMSTVEDENAMFSRLMAKSSKATQDYDVDDIFVDKASSSREAAKEQKRQVENVLNEEKAIKKVLDNCQWCFDGKYLQKNLIVSIGQTCFLCVPPFQSITEGHCMIVPMSHATCSTQLDEDVWWEMQKFRKALVSMFLSSGEDVVFYETAIFLKKQPHMYWECVPMPKETGELAPIYFKKAIQECETEWSQNKKLVDLRDRDVRRAIPKGLPYFLVEFGNDNCGFAHVIEDEAAFPKNFAPEIIGGMLELDHQLWRKQKREDFSQQRAKLMNFLRMWEPFDFTKETKS